ncbi:MAG TPA: glycosyltransferase [Xanthomonadaceae bacterium]|nr:glycosyltransferase [Xanthomonadaceae bacterium]
MSAQRDTLAAIAGALGSGDLQRAGTLLRDARASMPDDANVRMFDAVLAQREGRLDAAVAMLQALAVELPQVPQIAFHLGNCLKDAGEHLAAQAQYARVLALQPGHADAAYNLGVCRVQDDPVQAGPWFVRAARSDFRLHDAYLQLLRCASDAAALAPPPRPPAEGIGAQEHISVVTCSVRPERLEKLRASCEAALAGGPWELVHIADARSLCEGYRRGIARATGTILVLCHDDVRLLAPDFRARLVRHLEHFDLVGPAGTTRMQGPSIVWGGPPHAHNWVMYPGRVEGTVRVTIASAFGPVVAGTQALDGLLMAGRRACFERIGFDAETFDGFHHYDLDFSYRAFRAGLKLATCQDLLVEHASEGRYDEHWKQYAVAFQRKFPELARAPFSSAPTAYDMDQVPEQRAIAMLGWIDYWERQVNAVSPGAQANAR